MLLKVEQEAQLSLRDRATLRVTVIEYFAKSLKLTQGHSPMTLLSRACVSPY